MKVKECTVIHVSFEGKFTSERFEELEYSGRRENISKVTRSRNKRMVEVDGGFF